VIPLLETMVVPVLKFLVAQFALGVPLLAELSTVVMEWSLLLNNATLSLATMAVLVPSPMVKLALAAVLLAHFWAVVMEW
jgi:hypothetical protein